MASFGTQEMSERDEVDFRVLRAISANPEMTQRQLAKSAGISLGAVNYCLKALAEKGLVKVQNFQASDRKLRYAYILTPRGAAAKGRLAIRFLKQKLGEYDLLEKEITKLIEEYGSETN